MGVQVKVRKRKKRTAVVMKYFTMLQHMNSVATLVNLRMKTE